MFFLLNFDFYFTSHQMNGWVSEWSVPIDNWKVRSANERMINWMIDICMWSWFHSSSSTQSNLTGWRSRGSIYFQIQRLNVSLCGIQLVRSDFNGLMRCWRLKLCQNLRHFELSTTWLMMPTTCLVETYFCVNQISTESFRSIDEYEVNDF